MQKLRLSKLFNAEREESLEIELPIPIETQSQAGPEKEAILGEKTRRHTQVGFIDLNLIFQFLHLGLCQKPGRLVKSCMITFIFNSGKFIGYKALEGHQVSLDVF